MSLIKLEGKTIIEGKTIFDGGANEIWILATGLWNDSGYWNDNQIWADNN